jgi:ribonuclease R
MRTLVDQISHGEGRVVNMEGLVHVSSLNDDYYHYVEKLHLLRGEKKKSSYRIGDTVRVRVDRVDAVRKRIDFSLSED